MRESERSVARVHAAWLLEHFGLLEDSAILKLLHDQHPGVREHAALLAERRLAGGHEFCEAVIALASDPDPRVRFQAALTLSACEGESILPALIRIAVADADDPWTRIAIACAVPHHSGRLVRNLLCPENFLAKITPARIRLVEELLRVVGARLDLAEVDVTLNDLASRSAAISLPWQLAVLNGLTEGMNRRGVQLERFLRTLPAVKTAADPAKAEIVNWTTRLFARSNKIAADTSQELPARLPAVRVLTHASWTLAQPTLVLLLADPVQEIRLAAVNALAGHQQPQVAALLMKSWRSHTPAVRREVLDAMLRQPARVEFLLDELQTQHVKPADIDVASTRRLLNNPQAKTRDRARRLLQDNLPTDRKLVLSRYQAALKIVGEPERGREIFKKNCATCHRVAGMGVDVGPDISDTRTKTAAGLLVDILNPNQAIDNNAISYVVTTKSGKSLTGLIAAETASSITLRRAEAQTDVVLRQDIEEIQSTGVSLMPEGLEKNISIPEMADLLAFLKNWRYLGGQVPLGK